jgi:hypothetical protein
MTLEGGNAVKGTGLAGAIARARKQAYPEGYVSSRDPLVNLESKAIIDYLKANGSTEASDIYVVASQAEQLALAASQGDVAVRTDVSMTYMHNGGTSGTILDWTVFLSSGGGGGGISSVNGDTGPAVTLTQDDIPDGATYVRTHVDFTTTKDSNLSTAYSHSSSTSNPHGVTASQVSLGSVTNDAQLKRSANDFTSFSVKATPTVNDVILIEDAGASGAKKYSPIGNLPLSDGSMPKCGFAEGTSTASIISVTDISRTFSIAPSSVSFDFYVDGTKHTKTTAQTAVFTDDEGLHYFYFNSSGVLTTTTDSSVWYSILIGGGALVGIVMWDTDTNKSIMVLDERHGFMEGSTHRELHLSFGMQWVSGGALTTMSVDGTGDLAANAEFSVTDIVVLDEDLRFSFTDGVPQDLAPVAQIPVLWRSGATGVWRMKVADNYPLIYSGTAGYTGAAGRAPYNQWTGSTWQLTQIGAGKFFCTHYFATNDIAHPIIGVQGQGEYNSIIEARASANTVLASLLTGTLPLPEMKTLATVIWQTDSGYANTPKSRVRTTDTGGNYVDWRSAGKTTLTSNSSTFSGVARSGSTVDNTIARWNGANADSIQGSGIAIDDSNNVTGILSITTAQYCVDNTLSSDHSFAGNYMSVTVLDNAYGFGGILYPASGGYSGADADASATLPGVVIALETGTGTKKVGLPGCILIDASWSWTIGGNIYVSKTASNITQTAPTSTGAFRQKIGIALTATTMMFLPELTVYEIGNPGA